jgi:hypothetical protein
MFLQIFAGPLPVALAKSPIRAENEQRAETTQRYLIRELWQLVDIVDGCTIIWAQRVGQMLKAVHTKRFVAAW